MMVLGRTSLNMQTVIFTTVQTFYCLNLRKHTIADFFAVILNQGLFFFYNDHDLQDFFSSQITVECHFLFSAISVAIASLEVSDAQEKQFTIISTKTR